MPLAFSIEIENPAKAGEIIHLSTLLLPAWSGDLGNLGFSITIPLSSLLCSNHVLGFLGDAKSTNNTGYHGIRALIPCRVLWLGNQEIATNFALTGQFGKCSLQPNKEIAETMLSLHGTEALGCWWTERWSRHGDWKADDEANFREVGSTVANFI